MITPIEADVIKGGYDDFMEESIAINK